jgi:hypothetical protein
VERLAEIPVAAVVVERRDSALYKLEHVSGALDDKLARLEVRGRSRLQRERRA